MRVLIGTAVHPVCVGPRPPQLKSTQPGTGLGRLSDHSGMENSLGWKGREEASSSVLQTRLAWVPSRIPANSKKFLLSPSHHYHPRASLIEVKEGRRCQNSRPLRTVQFQPVVPEQTKEMNAELWGGSHKIAGKSEILESQGLEKWSVKTLGHRVCYLKPGKRFTTLYIITVTITAD